MTYLITDLSGMIIHATSDEPQVSDDGIVFGSTTVLDLNSKNSVVHLVDAPLPAGFEPCSYRWLNGGYVFAGDSITSRQSAMKAEINARRDALETQGFPHAGLWFQSDERSVARINSTALTAASSLMAGASAQFPDWLAADNTPLPVDANGVLALQASLTAHAGALHAHARSLKLMADAAETVDDLNSIDLTSGWPGSVA